MGVTSAFWPLFGLVFLSAAVFLVPWPRWKQFFPAALVAGFAFTIVLQYLLGSILGAWEHRFPALDILGVSAWLALGWFAEVLLFLHFLPESAMLQAAYIGIFAAGTSVVAIALDALGARPMLRGFGAVATFVLAVLLHFAILGVDRVLRAGPARV